jgi:signal peptidase II
MKKSLQLFLVLLVLLCCVGCDQVVKAYAKGALAFSPPVLLLDGAVRFQYAENPGAFLSLGAGLPAGIRYLLGVVLASPTTAG